jgi:hypothetical protein
MDNNDIFDGLGVEVNLKDKDAFLKVRETLTRIGVSSNPNKKLYQSCHILHKKGRYAIMHFKELFVLDGLDSDMDETDLARRNTIVKLLVEWGLVDPVDENRYKEPQLPLNKLKIIPFKEKGEWNLVPKYHIGKK